MTGFVAVSVVLRALGVNDCQNVPLLFVPSVTPGQLVPGVQALAGSLVSKVSVTAPVKTVETVFEK
jgi:hypothetical protein